MAAEPLEARMARLEGAYEQIDKRLGALEAALEGLRAEIRDQVSGLRGEMRQEISDLRREMRQQFHWLLGVLVVAILVQIALRYLPGPTP